MNDNCKLCRTKTGLSREKASELNHCIYCHETWENYIAHIKTCSKFLKQWEENTGRPLVAD